MTFVDGSDKAAMDYTLKYNPPMDFVVIERNLKEVKQILDGLGVVFLLGSGTCLGAIRDKGLIPWDDDIDLVSVLGLNGLTEESIESAVVTFRNSGYYAKQNRSVLDRPPYGRSYSIIKDYARVDWSCSVVVDDVIYAYPGIQLPAKLFTDPKEIEFLGEGFYVPNPPEEYLRLKYGTEWMIPKKSGEYEIDVVEKIPDGGLVGRPSRLKVLDVAGQPVSGAEVVLVGCGRTKTDRSGYAEVIVPGRDWYALIIRYPGHEQVLYMEEMDSDKNYVYRADSVSEMVNSTSGEIGTLGNVLLPE